MAYEEVATRRMALELAAGGIDARPSHDGKKWSVDIEPGSPREAWIDCYFGASRFEVQLWEHRREVASGHTVDTSLVVACVRSWVAGVELNELCMRMPYLHTDPFVLEGIARCLPSDLEWKLRGAYERASLFIKHRDRSCIVKAPASCYFCIGNVQVAAATHLADPVAAITTWLTAGISVEELGLRVPGAHRDPTGRR